MGQHLAAQTGGIEDDDEADEAIYPRLKALRVMTALKDLAWPRLAAGGHPPGRWKPCSNRRGLLYGAGAGSRLPIWNETRRNSSEPRPATPSGWVTARLAGGTCPRQAEAPTQAAPAAASPPQPEGFFAKLAEKIEA